MIRSMTGYGRAEVAGVRLSLSVECKSLNHRHVDIALRLPRALSAFELDARRLIQGAVQRGRVEVSVGVAPLEGAPAADLTINMAQARAYAALVRRAGDELNLPGPPALQWLLGQPGVITREEQTPLSPEGGWPLLHDAPDEARLATEVAMWAEKSDITEELARLRAHMGELARLLDEGGAVGRTLDFLIQEMNREVNTVGSKADDLELSQAAIGAKSTLEKLREQAQNIE